MPMHCPFIRFLSSYVTVMLQPMEKSRKESTKALRMCGEIFHQVRCFYSSIVLLVFNPKYINGVFVEILVLNATFVIR